MTFIGANMNLTVPANPDGLTIEAAFLAGQTGLAVNVQTEELLGERFPQFLAHYVAPGAGVVDVTNRLQFAFGDPNVKDFAVMQKQGAEPMTGVRVMLLGYGG